MYIPNIMELLENFKYKSAKSIFIYWAGMIHWPILSYLDLPIVWIIVEGFNFIKSLNDKKGSTNNGDSTSK